MERYTHTHNEMVSAMREKCVSENGGSRHIHPNEIEMGFKYRIMYFIHVGLYIYEKIHLCCTKTKRNWNEQRVKMRIKSQYSSELCISSGGMGWHKWVSPSWMVISALKYYTLQSNRINATTTTIKSPAIISDAGRTRTLYFTQCDIKLQSIIFLKLKLIQVDGNSSNGRRKNVSSIRSWRWRTIWFVNAINVTVAIRIQNGYKRMQMIKLTLPHTFKHGRTHIVNIKLNRPTRMRDEERAIAYT